MFLALSSAAVEHVPVLSRVRALKHGIFTWKSCGFLLVCMLVLLESYHVVEKTKSIYYTLKERVHPNSESVADGRNRI